MPPEDVRRLVDIEADLDEGQLSQVRFGRRRFLRTLGLALFGVATGMVAMSPEAEARRTPTYCFGAPGCNCCRNRSYPESEWCCERGCTVANSCNNGTTQCWTVCRNGNQYKCCDFYRHNGKLCMCQNWIGYC